MIAVALIDHHINNKPSYEIRIEYIYIYKTVFVDIEIDKQFNFYLDLRRCYVITEKIVLVAKM